MKPKFIAYNILFFAFLCYLLVLFKVEHYIFTGIFCLIFQIPLVGIVVVMLDLDNSDGVEDDK